MLQKVANFRDQGRKVSPPQPTFMTKDQQSTYLSDLRNNRPTRPSGARPSPFQRPKSARHDLPPRAESALTSRPTEDEDGRPSKVLDEPSRAVSLLETHQRAKMELQTSDFPSVRGRKVLPTAAVQTPLIPENRAYREGGARWIERQEAHYIREALEVMDHRTEEERIHAAAQDEASELVYRHRNPKAYENEKNQVFGNPDLKGQNPFKTHLAEGAHARSQSMPYGKLNRSAKNEDSTRSASGGSQDSNENPNAEDGREFSRSKGHILSDALSDLKIAAKRSVQIAGAPAARIVSGGRRKSSGHRNVSRGSSKGVFRNPQDQIYEESNGLDQHIANSNLKSNVNSEPLKARSRNSLPRGSRPLPWKSSKNFSIEALKIDRSHVHRNPSSQPRAAGYTTNPPILPEINVMSEVEAPSATDSIEVRSDDIRAATSRRRNDRSPKLPTPTAVSDRLGRPIVSFDPAWTPPSRTSTESGEHDRPQARPTPSIPTCTVSAPSVSTIDQPVESTLVPTISVTGGDDIPMIALEDSPTPSIGMPKNTTARPLPQHSQSSPPKFSNTRGPASRPVWLKPKSTGGVPTAACSSCYLPIAGRIVTASGCAASAAKARFHPECFTCHHCSTALEHVSFYPEPDIKREERFASAGVEPGPEEDLRFYCHLDFHDLFSPRCRSCKTPIEGEVTIALSNNSTYHPDHFFCAECGDPFSTTKPFVEGADGYAYCVSCHTKRTSARCQSCKKQILDETTVAALGGKWHEECFRCVECDGSFGDDGKFFVRGVEVEATDKEKRRGIKTRIEDRAVCERCEEIRLKA